MSFRLFISTTLAIALFAACGITERPNFGVENVNDNWTFFRADSAVSTNDSLGFINGNFDSQSCDNVNLPHTPHFEPEVVNNQWQGICYYRREIALTAKDLRCNLFLRFDAAMNEAIVYINGKEATRHLGGYLPFAVKLNEYAKEGNNTIVVRLDNRDNAITGPKPLKLLDFNTYGGLYRSVWLEKRSDVYITDANYVTSGDAGIYFRTVGIDNQSAASEVKTNVANESTDNVEVTVLNSLVSAEGTVVARQSSKQIVKSSSSYTFAHNLDFRNPHLWSPNCPYLYSLQTSVFIDNRLVDFRELHVGIRTIEVSANGLLLNGKEKFLRGVNRHQEYPYIGYALSDEAQWRDARLIKDAGFDYVRCSHYPPSPAFLDACDKIGILVLDAILGWQYFGNEAFESHTIDDCHQLLRRDRNHACILAWELSVNETMMPKSFTSKVAGIRDVEAPSTYTAGWQKEGYDIFLQARQHRHSVDSLRPLIVSEYGDWEYYAQNAGFNQEGWQDLMQEERTSRQARNSGDKRLLQQARNIEEAHNDNRLTHAFADGYWVMFDYNRGYSPDLETSGIADIFRLPKPAYHFFASQRGVNKSEPMLYIANALTDNNIKEIRIFSNCDSISVKADGKLLTQASTTMTQVAHPSISFYADEAPELIEAWGYIGGKEVVRQERRKPQSPEKLTIDVALNDIALKAAKNDAVFVYTYVTDANSTVVTTADMPITLRIATGDATFVTENGYCKEITVKPAAGIAPALLQAGRTASEITIEAEADGLQTTRKDITSL
ncbi:MAG: glycoside hydrolase family 2 protein [Bacteroidales bacterium]|jgi:beta-galactosidase|nr:glycoside hydrolase family 2 protein [Bacteroidales bacterium]